MKIGNIIGALVVLIQFLQVASICNNPDNLQKDGWELYNGALYNSFDKTLLNYTASENYCQQYGGSLVTIKNGNENAFVYSLRKNGCYYPIGLRFVGDKWMWNDGTPVKWTNWQSGQWVDVSYKCAHIGHEHFWWKTACNAITYGTICKCSIAVGCNSSNPCSDLYADCINGTCQCRSGYTLNGTSCKADVGCNSSNPCFDPYEDCTSEVCQCRSGYTFNGTSCTAGLNSPCDSSIGCSQKFAECKATTSGINNTCQCMSNYSVVYGYFCLPDNGANCDVCYRCFNRFADCNGICQCRSGYKTSGNLCKADVGFPCDATNGCSSPYADCTFNSTCQCRPGYIKTGTLCKADLNSSCTINIGCSDQYAECKVPTSETNGTCQCQNTYSAVGGICKADLNSSCNTSSGCSDQYAECKATTPGANNTCQCKSNYTVVGGICRADLNSFCSTSIGCSDQFAECKTPTSGTNATCQCKNTYMAAGGICKADLNSSCNTISGCSDQYAECKATTPGANNTCQCKSNYTVVGGICRADLNSSCNTINGCSDQYAECKATTLGANNTCQCKSNYTVVGGICRADLNSFCTTSIGCSDQFAECKTPTSGTNATCQCKNTYSAAGGICKADLNSSCNTINGCSDQYAECKATTLGANNTCQCKSNYTVVGGICRTDLNSFCTTSIGCSDQFAECKTPTSGTNATCQCKNTYSAAGGICKADGYYILDGINITNTGDIYNGSSVNITCITIIVGNVTPTLTWKYNGNDINPVPGFRITVSTITVEPETPQIIYKTVSFNPIQSSDSGTYECVVMDGNSSPSVMNKTVIVISQPEVFIQPVTQTVDAGSTVNITCQVGNDVPITQMVWYRNSTEINSTNKLSEEKFSNGTRTNVLTRTNIQYTTMYECRGNNSAGPGNTRKAIIYVVLLGSHHSATCINEIDKRGTNWSRTLQGTYDNKSCPTGMSGEAVRYCSQDGVWRDPSYDNCINTTLLELKTLTDNIKNGLAPNRIPDYLVNLTSVTNPNNVELQKAEVQVVSTVLDNVIQISNNTKNITNIEVENFLEIASNVIDVKNSPSWQALIKEDKEGASRILRNVEKYSSIKAKSTNSTEPVKSFTKKNLFVEIGYKPVSDIQFPNTTANGSAFNNGSSSRFVLSQNAWKNGNYTSYSGAYFNNVSGIMQKNLLHNGSIINTGADLEINSAVLSLQLDPPPSLLSPPLVLTFQHFSANYSNPTCRSWMFNADGSGNGAWSGEGCKLVSTSDDTTVCQCDHLTNFAILMSPGKTPAKDQVPLSIISITGCAISIFCLSVTMIAHLIVWRYVKSARSSLLMNLCAALLISYVIFLAGVDRTKNKNACTAVAAILHYFYLSVFFLMLAFGIDIAVSVIYVFVTRSRIRWLLPIAWLLPAVIVAVSLGVTKLEGYGNEKFCWLSIEHGLIWAFVGPAALVILLNFIIVIVVFHRMFSSSAMMTKSDKVKAKTAVRSLCVLLPITGITWVFGILSVNEDLVVFQYLFAIINSLQGLFIFLIHCVFNHHLKEAIKKMNASRKRSQVPFSTTLKSSSNSSEPKTCDTLDEYQKNKASDLDGRRDEDDAQAATSSTTRANANTSADIEMLEITTSFRERAPKRRSTSTRARKAKDITRAMKHSKPEERSQD